MQRVIDRSTRLRLPPVPRDGIKKYILHRRDTASTKFQIREAPRGFNTRENDITRERDTER